MELDDHGFEIDSRWTKRSVCLDQNSDCEHWSWVASWPGSAESVLLGYQALLNVVEQTGRLRIRERRWPQQKSGVGSNDVVARSLRQGVRARAAKVKRGPRRWPRREGQHRWKQKELVPVRGPHGNPRTQRGAPAVHPVVRRR